MRKTLPSPHPDDDRGTVESTCVAGVVVLVAVAAVVVFLPVTILFGVLLVDPGRPRKPWRRD